LLQEPFRSALGGRDDGGRASYQIALTRCAHFCRGSAGIDAGGERHVGDGTVSKMAECDAQQTAPRSSAPCSNSAMASAAAGSAMGPQRVWPIAPIATHFTRLLDSPIARLILADMLLHSSNESFSPRSEDGDFCLRQIVTGKTRQEDSS
jgi:hypothetical protein